MAITRGNVFSRVDWTTVFLYVLLVTMGWFVIYATDYNAARESVLSFQSSYGRQLIWIFIAFTMAFFLLLIESRFFTTISYTLYGLVMLALLGVLFFGEVTGGSRSWYAIAGLKIQPAEFAKFATSLAIARYLSRYKANIQRITDKAVALLLMALPMGLIVLQGDAGSALVYTAFIIVFFREGLSPFYLILGIIGVTVALLTLVLNKYLLITGIIILSLLIIWRLVVKELSATPVVIAAVLSIGLVIGVDYGFNEFLADHQQQRIKVLLGLESDVKGAAYNVTQSKIAIGSGGIWGKGYLQGTQTKFDFVPEQSTDFIFCTVGEEQGFLGTTIVVGLFLIFLLRLVLLAEQQRSSYTRIYGYSVVSILLFHFFVNIGMTIGLAPIIGIPLPFFSYGGSNLLGFTILLFIFLRLDADRKKILV